MELAFHFGLAVNQEFDALALLTLGDLQRKGRISDRATIPDGDWLSRIGSRTGRQPSVRGSLAPQGYSEAYNKECGEARVQYGIA